MNITESVEEVQLEGDNTRVCRHSDWMDVFTFLALDFGFRAVTVLTPPGSTGLQSALTCLWALICPAYGVRRALLAVGFPENHKGDSELEESIRNAWGRIKARVVGGERRSELELALRSGALSMLVPSTVRIRSSQGAKPGPSVDEIAATEGSSAPKTTGREALPLESINPLMTSVHGQYPSDITPLCSPPVPPAREDEESGKGPAPPAEYSLVKVPSSFKVNPIMTEDGPEPLIGIIWRWIGMKESSSAETQKPKGLEESQSAVRRPKKAVPLRLSSNERIVKAICTIFQILYGSYELYRMGGDHLKKYGYAAYEFTIIPYLSMSLMNLLVSCVRPTYPSMYIVHYRGYNQPTPKKGEKTIDRAGDRNDTSSSNNQRSTTEDHGKSALGQTEVMLLDVNEGADETQTLAYPEYWWDPSDRKKLEDNVIGAIECVYGDFAKDTDGSEGKHHHFFSISTWKKRFLANPFFAVFVLTLYILLYYAAPYIVIQALTGFDRGNSTPLQRGCIIMWIASGQICPDFIEIIACLLPERSQRSPSVYPTMRIIILGSLHVALIGFPTCAGVYMVATMILEGNICTEL